MIVLLWLGISGQVWAEGRFRTPSAQAMLGLSALGETAGL